MGLIEYYIIFAVTTAIACWYDSFWPLVSEARSVGIVNEFTQHPLMSSIIFLILSSLAAPILIIPFLSAEKSERFRDGLRKSIFEQK